MSVFSQLDLLLLGNISADNAISRFREILNCEARYAGLRPDAITISSNLNVPDGGIDAQVDLNSKLPLVIV